MFSLDSVGSEITVSNGNSQTNSFTFDPQSPSDFLSQKVQHRNNVAQRLERLINEPTVGGHPFILYMLKNVPEATPEELRTIAKALERVADLIEPFQKIDAEVRGLTWAKENTNLIACAFGQFEAPEDPAFFAQSTKEI